MKRIPIEISPIFPIVAFILAFLWSGGSLLLTSIIFVVITISILVHEFGHALTALFFKQKVKISLLPLGGLTERKGKPLKAWQDFLIVLMGPAFGFMLYFVCAYAMQISTTPLQKQVFAIAAMINLYWTVLNLLPVIPLDGGQMVRIILQGLFGIKGLKAACVFSMLVGAAITLYFVISGEMLIASLFALFVYESWRLLREIKYLKDHDTELPLQRMMSRADKARQKGELDKSAEIYTKVRKNVSSGALYNLATLHLAEKELGEGKLEHAWELLQPIKEEIPLDGLALFHELSFKIEKWQDALDSGTKVYQKIPSAELAYQNAKAAENLGLQNAANGWMRAYHSKQIQA